MKRRLSLLLTVAVTLLSLPGLSLAGVAREGGMLRPRSENASLLLWEYPVPTGNSQPYGITIDSSNRVWFTEVAGNKIGRLTPASGSAVSALPDAVQAVTRQRSK
jgi:streptogramin lyase